MSEPGPEFDPEILFREARSQFDQVAGMQRAMAELRGRAESQDGRVRAVYAQDQGLAEVELDPRAMRMSAADLGRLIVEVSGAVPGPRVEQDRRPQQAADMVGTKRRERARCHVSERTRAPHRPLMLAPLSEGSVSTLRRALRLPGPRSTGCRRRSTGQGFRQVG